jgi:hypothetical protein
MLATLFVLMACAILVLGLISSWKAQREERKMADWVRNEISGVAADARERR